MLNNSKKGQALSELAIFGTLIIVGFAAMLSYIQSMNSQQSLQMEAFRKAFKLSRQLNKDVSYTIVKDSPMVDVGDIFGRPDTSRVSASATLSARKKFPDTKDEDDPDDRESAEFYEVNGRVYKLIPVRIELRFQSGDPRKVWISAPISDTQYRATKQRTGSITKSEGVSSITTTRTGSITTRDATALVMEDQEAFKQNYLEDAQDEVETEPWQKRKAANYRNSILKASVDLLAPAIYFYLDTVDAGCDIMGKKRAVAMIIGSAFMAIEALTYNAVGSSGKVTRVSIIGAYPAGQGVCGDRGFSEPQPAFSVSQ